VSYARCSLKPKEIRGLRFEFATLNWPTLML
jgi:hypothetical protein